ncbi:glycosyltransferase family 4 protein [Planctomycetota bacterium]
MPEDLRILHILSQRPGFSGSGIFLQAMVREAARRGFKQQAIAGGPAGTSYIELPPLQEDDLHVVQFPHSERSFEVPGMSDVMPYPSTVFSSMTAAQIESYQAAFRSCMETVRARYQPDIVHCHHLWLVTALAREVFAGIPVIGSAHGTALRQLQSAPHLGPRVIPGIQGLDRICVLTSESRQNVIDAYGAVADRIEITGAGFRDDIFFPAETDRKKVLSDLADEHGINIPEGYRLIVYVGRLSTPKGVPYLLRAFREVCQRSPASCKLVLVGGVGSGEDGKKVEKQAAAAGDDVICTGPRKQEVLADILRLSDVFILPSLFEGLPLVMLEALACGCAVAVSALPTILSWVAQDWLDQGHVRLIKKLQTVRADTPVAADEPRFVKDISATLLEILTRESTPAGRSRRAQLVQSHTWRAVFQRYEDIYQLISSSAR